MGPAETASSPPFSVLEPIVVDDQMENPYQDSNLDFLDSARLQMSSENAGRDFDDLFAHSTSSRTVTESGSVCLSPSELSVKRPYQEQDVLRQPNLVKSDSPAESPEASSRSSSSESPRNHIRNPSVASSTSAVHSENTMMPFGYTSEDWINPDLATVKEEMMFGFDPSLPSMETDTPFTAETDLESSNKAMDAAFDFESAASSPSPLRTGTTPQPMPQKMADAQFRSASNSAAKHSTSPVSQPPVSNAV